MAERSIAHQIADARLIWGELEGKSKSMTLLAGNDPLARRAADILKVRCEAARMDLEKLLRNATEEDILKAVDLVRKVS